MPIISCVETGFICLGVAHFFRHLFSLKSQYHSKMLKVEFL